MKAAIVMGSKSDYDVVKRAIDILESFEVEAEVRIISAHRTPEAASNFLKRIDDEKIEVVIAAAGKAAHDRKTTIGGSGRRCENITTRCPTTDRKSVV